MLDGSTTPRPDETHDAQPPTLQELPKHLLLDGYPMIWDLEASHGSWIVDARDGTEYLDAFTFFSSLPLGYNPPCLVDNPANAAALQRAAIHKPSNPDSYTREYDSFVEAFSRVLGDPNLPLYLFIDGGALAVENALKLAFDWKAQRLRIPWASLECNTLSVMHLEAAFHGRSGYTLSLTNTDPAKLANFPRWTWPRIPSPAQRHPLERNRVTNERSEELALQQAESLLRKDPKVAAFIFEPIQCEGGDRHLSAEFLRKMQNLCRQHDVLVIADEVQTGCYATGTAWAYQQLDLEPDIVCFGKKTQVCGIMAGRRIGEIRDHALAVPSRLSSTWGGNLVDMVRSTIILNELESTSAGQGVRIVGSHLLDLLEAAERRHPALLSNARGRGLLCAIDATTAEHRDKILQHMLSHSRVLALPCGDNSIRFRPHLAVTKEEVQLMAHALEHAASALSAQMEGR